jgi:hypothetical protein
MPGSGVGGVVGVAVDAATGGCVAGGVLSDGLLPPHDVETKTTNATCATRLPDD